MRKFVAAGALAGVLLLVQIPAWAQAETADQMWAEIRALLRTFDDMGKKEFETRWPEGQQKEKYTVSEDGTRSYTKFFPAGNYAERYQRKPDGTVSYEKWYGNGKSAVQLTHDDRMTTYTSHWPNELTKVKFQFNRQTEDKFFVRYDSQGKQVIP